MKHLQKIRLLLIVALVLFILGRSLWAGFTMMAIGTTFSLQPDTNVAANDLHEQFRIVRTKLPGHIKRLGYINKQEHENVDIVYLIARLELLPASLTRDNQERYLLAHTDSQDQIDALCKQHQLRLHMTLTPKLALLERVSP